MQSSTYDKAAWAEAAAQHVEPPSPVGWTEVCKGLCWVMGGRAFFLTLFALVFKTVFLPIWRGGSCWGAAGSIGMAGSFGASLVILIVLVLLFVSAMFVTTRNLWRCLRNAPERNGAKWWMYGALLCRVGLPVLFITLIVVGFTDAPTQASRHKNVTLPVTFRELHSEVKETLTTATSLELDFLAIFLLHCLFMTLFFRSVALYFYDSLRARFAELFLLLNAALITGFAVAVFSPATFLAQPLLIPILYGGLSLSTLWYVALFVSTITCIQSNMSAMRSPLL